MVGASVLLGALLASCSSAGGSGTATTATTAAGGSTTSTTSAAPSSSVSASAIPVGDGHVGTTPQAGSVDSCTTSFRGGGAEHAGPWIDSAAGTWDATAKIAVEGSVSWPDARYDVTTSGSSRVVTGNDLPIDHTTGVFPIAATDPAYRYDHNPNSIEPQTVDWTLPLDPAAASSPGCLGLGPIGMLSDGVLLFDALDAAGRDAGAHEVQDACGEHPQMNGTLHHHSVPSCILDKIGHTAGSSTLVGYAADGYGIYAEYDASGHLPTDAALDACHGRTSTVEWNGAQQRVYHYDVTLEYPYTLGCYHGTPIQTHGG